jgi:glycosyltransferase involved in cell wall biosynthesis
MKVAFLAFNFSEYCVRLASGIADDDETSVLLLLPNTEAQPYLPLLSKAVRVKLFDKPRLRQPISQVRMVIQLLRQITSFNPDVIHLQQGHLWFNLLALPFLGKYPLVLTVHDAVVHVGDDESRKTPQWVYDRGRHSADQLIVHAQHVKDLVLQITRIPESAVHVIPHIFIGENTRTAQENKQVERPLILFFGRIWEYKGLEYLIRAEPLITSKVPQAKIVIAGVGENLDRYRRMMVHPEQFIVYNDYVSDAMRDDLFRSASVVVLPYIEASQSGVIPMAYRFSKPVVATTVGGLPEMVDDGVTGYLVPPRDPDSLADAIKSLLQDSQKRERFGANGLRKVNAECGQELIGRLTRAVYRKTVATAYHDAPQR